MWTVNSNYYGAHTSKKAFAMVSGPTIIDAKTKQDMCFTICNFDKETNKYVFNAVG